MSAEFEVPIKGLRPKATSLHGLKPHNCEGCVNLDIAASNLPIRAEQFGIEVEYLTLPFAEVAGFCQDGFIESDFCGIKGKCSNPNINSNNPHNPAEQIILKVLEQADQAQNGGRGEN